MKINREIAEAAAEWWAGKIDGHQHHDNGDESPTGLMGMVLADMLNEPATPEQIDKFKETFIESFLAMDLELWPYFDLYCDYHPPKVLADAAKAAGINANNFPFKTSMMVYEDKIVVSGGYRQPRQQIWPAVNT